MSLPTAPIAAALAQAGPIAPLDMVIMSVNTNPYFIGTMMLLLNFGGRFLSLEMSKSQEQFFQNTWVRRCLIFTVIFVGTRNIMVAFWMSMLVILCIGYLFNENSSLCLFQFGEPGSKCASNPGIIPTMLSPSPTDISSSSSLTQEENEILKRLQDKQQKSMVSNHTVPQSHDKKVQNSPNNIYWENMNYLNKEGFINPRF